MVNLTSIWYFSLINWVDNVNWPPSIVSKLTPRALALRQSDWRNCVFTVFTRLKRRSGEFMVLEKCGVMFTSQTRLNKGNFPFNLDNTLSVVQFPFLNKHGHSEWCFSRDRAGTTSFSSALICACLKDAHTHTHTKKQTRRLKKHACMFYKIPRLSLDKNNNYFP